MNSSQVAAIGRWAADRGLWVVTDEIYEHLVYGDAQFTLDAGPRPGAGGPLRRGQRGRQDLRHDRLAGRLDDRPQGHGPAATNLQSHATSNVANVSQVAALAAVTGDLTAVAGCARRSTAAGRDGRDARRDRGRHLPAPEGAFYCFPSVKGAARPELRGQRPTTSAELAALILDEVEVAVVPGEAFGAPGFFRLSYALGDDDLVEGVAGCRCCWARPAPDGRAGPRITTLPKAHLHLHFTGAFGAGHLRLAFFPLAGGTPVPVVRPVTLPRPLFQATTGGALQQRAFTGTAFGPATQVTSPVAIPWGTVNGAFKTNARHVHLLRARRTACCKAWSNNM